MKIRKKIKHEFPFEIEGNIYRHKGGAFIKTPEGFFKKVGSGKGNYSVNIKKLRRRFF